MTLKLLPFVLGAGVLGLGAVAYSREARRRGQRTAPAEEPRVVVVGAGFGGLALAQALAGEAVRVTVLDRANHHLFQPLLYQVATGVLSPAEIAAPTRFVLGRQRNVEVRLAAAERVDPDRRAVVLEGGGEVPYDLLVIATGARHAYFNHPEWESHAPGLKSLEDARTIRTRMLRALERAETTDDAAERTALLTFVIVGAGPTGVELAGVLPTIIRNAARRAYRHIDPSEVRVVLFEGGERVLPAFDTALSDRARRDLESLGVEVRTGTLVTDVRPDGVSVGEEWIPARTTLWAAGNEASPLVRSLGAPLDRAGRALVKPDLSVPGLPEVFVIGDAAAAEVRPSAEADARSWQGPGKDVPQGTSAAPGAEPTYVPGVAPAATQMGQHVAATIRRALHGEPRQPFYYRDKGNLAVIGRGSAVAEFGGLKLTGPVAWATWLFVHVLYLVGFRNRAVVLVSWAYSYLGNRPNAALITSDVPDDTPVARPNHPGQTSRFSTASRNSMKKTTPKKTTPPRQDPAEIRETIDPDSNVEQASLESFPASDAPGYTGAEATPGGSGSYSAEDAEKARARDTASGEEDAPAEDDL